MSNESRMMMDNLESRVIAVIAEQVTGRADTAHLIKPETHLYKDLRCDSLEIVELTLELENKFGIKIDDDDMAKFTTVQEIISHVEDVCTAQELAS